LRNRGAIDQSEAANRASECRPLQIHSNPIDDRYGTTASARRTTS
jgi:hypothetical protein